MQLFTGLAESDTAGLCPGNDGRLTRLGGEGRCFGLLGTPSSRICFAEPEGDVPSYLALFFGECSNTGD